MELTIHNRQQTRPIDKPLLRKLVRELLEDRLQVENYELGITFVAAPEMTRINESFLNHEGSTDVITFDHSETSPRPQTPSPKPELHGELFICVDEAILQARQFRTTWQSELLRYIIHGVLHLVGHDDHRAIDRRKMKREENRLLRLVLKSYSRASASTSAMCRARTGAR